MDDILKVFSIILVALTIIYVMCSIVSNNECDRLNELYKTQYTHDQYFWVSDQINKQIIGNKLNITLERKQL